MRTSENSSSRRVGEYPLRSAATFAGFIVSPGHLTLRGKCALALFELVAACASGAKWLHADKKGHLEPLPVAVDVLETEFA